MIVYFHRNPKTYEIFYVGIASESGRVQRPYKRDNRNKYWQHYVNKHGGFVVQLVHKGLTIEDACYWEQWYIKLLGKKINGGQLVNLADGGETNAGYTHTQKQRILSSERMKVRGTGHMMTKECREKAIKKISASLKGKLIGEKNPNYGKRHKWSNESRERQSAIQKARWAPIKKIVIKKERADYEESRLLNLKKSWGVKVLNTITGEVFQTIVDAANSIGMKKDTLRMKLNGKNPNNTSFIILQHDLACVS